MTSQRQHAVMASVAIFRIRVRLINGIAIVQNETLFTFSRLGSDTEKMSEIRLDDDVADMRCILDMA